MSSNRPAWAFAFTLLAACSEGNEPTSPKPVAPPPPAVPVYAVRPPDGKLPWPHHDPSWDQATFNRKFDSLWVVNNFGAYTGTSDRSILYLHNAWDLVLPNGTPIFAVTAGTVRAEVGGNQFYRSLMIEDDATPGFGWAYTHIYNFVVRPGQKVFQGTRLGSVNFQGLEHIHLSRVRLKPGGSWERFEIENLRPDDFFAYRDTEAPTFDGPFRYVRNLTDDAFTAPAGSPFITVSGDVDIVVGLRDGGEWTRSKAPFGGIPPGFGNAHSVSRIEYDIANSGGTIDRRVAFDLARTTIPEGTGAADAALLLTLYQHYESATPRPTGGSNNRFAFYMITNSPGTEPGQNVQALDPADASRAWETADLNSDGSRRYPNGEYTITVRAFDSKGNVSSRADHVIVNN